MNAETRERALGVLDAFAADRNVTPEEALDRIAALLAAPAQGETVCWLVDGGFPIWANTPDAEKILAALRPRGHRITELVARAQREEEAQ